MVNATEFATEAAHFAPVDRVIAVRKSASSLSAASLCIVSRCTLANMPRATHFYPPCFVSDCCIERGVRHSRILNRVADHWDTQPQTTLHRSYRFGGVRLALWLLRVA